MESDNNKKNPQEIKSKIISLLRIRGPSLPVHISKEANITSIFAGAFLSELANENEIKISNLKVGGSPLYFLQGHEGRLEKFYTYLQNKEKEAFLLIRQKRLLEDRKLEPAIRVALRNLKDFAIPLAPIVNNEKKIFWRFYSFPEEQAKQEIEKIIQETEPIIAQIPIQTPAEQPIKTIIEQKKSEVIEARETIKPEEIKPIPEIKIQEREKQKKLKPEAKEKIKPKLEEKLILKIKPRLEKMPVEKPEFVKKIIKLLETENIEILEEKEAKKKEFSSIIRINSELGKLRFLCIAKDKKMITENDLTLALQKAQSLKMPALLLSRGELNNKARAYLEQYSELVKFKRVT